MNRALTRLLWATRYSLVGLRIAWRQEQAFREEVVVLLLVVPAGLWLGRSGVERALLIGSWVLVLLVELVNSAIESVIDRIGLERHELAGKAKDLGSASVFCAIVLAIAVWALVLAG
jgi:diacylglycerol kinase (ATP)